MVQAPEHGFSGCGVQALQSQHQLSGHMACGILVTQPGIYPTSPVVEREFLTTGPPEKSHLTIILVSLQFIA